VLAYGEAAPIIKQDLNGTVPVEELAEPFDAVMSRARLAAQPGDAVLLSPACSSYDMFDNYEQRGRTFKELAAKFAATHG
jgi:UDP-N-acetylmuramoylalanine--D-glutamate ligase